MPMDCEIPFSFNPNRVGQAGALQKNYQQVSAHKQVQ